MPLIVAEQNPENFYPLTLTRATFELRYGAWCLLDRALRITQDVALRCRPELAEYLRAKTGLPVNEDIEGEVVPGLPAATPWEILAKSADLITADFEQWARHHRKRRKSRLSGVHIIGAAADLHISERAVVQPGCVLDVSGGPIIVAGGASVKFSYLQGPVFVGPGSLVEGARLRPGTSLGPGCRVGGEVSASIFQSRSNKAHDGYVGKSWVGQWVNFGALATTSNLKNTYGMIRYQRALNETVETGQQYLGALVGDYTKIGIGQMITTGANIGVGCNVFGAGVTPKYIPSFSWGGAEGWQEYRLDDCLKTIQTTLGSRDARLRPQSEELLRDVFQSTGAERRAWLHCRRTETKS